MLRIKGSQLALAIASALAVLAAPVSAQQASPAGFYIGAGLGVGQASYEGSDFDVTGLLNDEAVASGLAPAFTGSLSKDKTAFGYKFFAGYRFNQYFGVEGSWAYLGKFNLDGTFAYAGAPLVTASGDYEGSSWNLAAVGRYPFGNGFSVQGKLGAAFTTAKLSASINSASLPVVNFGTSEKENKTNFYWGLGLGYEFNPHVGLVLEYENFGKLGSSDTTGQVTMGLWTANILYKF